jgi:hypothetical protein
MVFNTTFNNISVISWWSVLLVEETGGPGKNHQPVSQVTDKLYHINDDDGFISEKSKAEVYLGTDPFKCINDHTLRSDTEFRGLEESVTLKIVRQNPPR